MSNIFTTNKLKNLCSCLKQENSIFTLKNKLEVLKIITNQFSNNTIHKFSL